MLVIVNQYNSYQISVNWQYHVCTHSPLVTCAAGAENDGNNTGLHCFIFPSWKQTMVMNADSRDEFRLWR